MGDGEMGDKRVFDGEAVGPADGTPRPAGPAVDAGRLTRAPAEMRAPADPPLALAALGLDASERGLLAVLRHLLQSRARPEGQNWEHGLGIAMRRFGLEGGARLMLAALDFLRALRAARPGTLPHADPLDLDARETVSAEEGAMMRMLRAMRRDLTPEARVQMLRLTGGRIDPDLVKTGLILVRALPRLTSGGVPVSAGPALRLVH